MELWLLWGVLSYFCYAVSTSLDKHFMNRKYEPLSTNAFKMFFDGIFLLSLGIIFFQLHFTLSLLWWSLLLGVLYATSSIFYFKALQLKEAGVLIPYTQGVQLFLIFIGAQFFLGEHARLWNYVGIALVVVGMYAVTSAKRLSFPRWDKGIYLITTQAILATIYSLFVKNALSTIEPINLAIVMYFVTALLLFCYTIYQRTRENSPRLEWRSSRIVLSALFGAIGTFLIYFALKNGVTYKIYSLAGLQAVFVFFIASLWLKEEFTWYRLGGTLFVFLGILLVLK